MKKLLLLAPLMIGLSAWAQEPLPDEEFRPEELIRELSIVQSAFEKEARKPVAEQNVDSLFPRAMYLLGVAQDILKDEKTRIPALVKLALATVPFDETVAAADVLTDDYKKHRSTYESEIEKQPREENRNRLLVSLRRYANFNPDAPEIVGKKSAHPPTKEQKK